jgi:hypothetical protein
MVGSHWFVPSGKFTAGSLTGRDEIATLKYGVTNWAECNKC